MFFDVRDRMQARDYIAAVAIGVAPDTGLAEDDIGSLMKQYAYSGGPLVLEALLEVLGKKSTIELGVAIAGGGVDEIAKTIRMAILARSIPVSERTATGLIRLQARLSEIEREFAADAAINGPIKASVERPFYPSLGPDSRSSRALEAVDGSRSVAGPVQSTTGSQVEPFAVAPPELNQPQTGTPVRRTA